MLGALPEDVRARDAVIAGQLMIRSFAEAYGTRRPDDLDTVAAGFRAAAERSRKSGFPGLRVAAQMDALAPLLGSVEEVLRYGVPAAIQRLLSISGLGHERLRWEP